MDGNRRYAQKHNISLTKGYKTGMEQFISILEFQIQHNIKHTSFFALSANNYKKRKKEELKPIFDLVQHFFEKKHIEQFFINNNIKISIKGNTQELNERKKEFGRQYETLINKLEKKLEQFNQKITNPSFYVHIAMNYDGQEELKHAFNKLQNQQKEAITLEDIKQNLYFYDVPSPEIIVRTGDAPRISGFLLFDSAYSEIYLCRKLWPEITKNDLEEILNWFSNLQRNFGK